LKSINAENIRQLKRAVSFTGTLKTMYQANYLLRTALQILKPIAEFEIKTADDLYHKILKIDWDKYMTEHTTFAINSVVYSTYFQHSGFVSLKTKDAIADYFRNKTGQRPPVSQINPVMGIEIHISETHCTVSINTTGDSLFKRGYRVQSGEAPLNEVLAAGMLLMTDFKEKKYLLDPMCGSGTILIEAAMIMLNIPCGKYRESFAFEKHLDFDDDLFDLVKTEAEFNVKNDCELKIQGYDIDRKTAILARRNIKSAGLESIINIETADFLKTANQEKEGIIITNPPYDFRIKSEDVNLLYNEIGTKLKHEYQGFDAWIFSGNLSAAKNIGLKPTKKIELFNGPIACKYQKFSLYSGSKKTENQ